MKSINRYKGNQGSYFAKHEKTGERVICIWSDLTQRTPNGLGYFDDAFTADATNPKFVEARDWLLDADKVLLTTAHVDANGNIIRKRADYVALWSIENCRVDADGLRFDFVERLESY